MQQVLDQARATGQDGLVLVGHSYGGSVINQVADRIPQQIAALVHLDSDLLEHGESCYTFTTPANREYFLEAVPPTAWAWPLCRSSTPAPGPTPWPLCSSPRG